MAAHRRGSATAPTVLAAGLSAVTVLGIGFLSSAALTSGFGPLGDILGAPVTPLVPPGAVQGIPLVGGLLDPTGSDGDAVADPAVDTDAPAGAPGGTLADAPGTLPTDVTLGGGGLVVPVSLVTPAVPVAAPLVPVAPPPPDAPPPAPVAPPVTTPAPPAAPAAEPSVRTLAGAVALGPGPGFSAQAPGRAAAPGQQGRTSPAVPRPAAPALATAEARANADARAAAAQAPKAHRAPDRAPTAPGAKVTAKP